jgi:hypothetical protein
MILDERLQVADAQAMSGAAGTINATDHIDTGAVVRDIGQGQTLYAVVSIITAPTGADTCKFQVVSDATTTIATDGSQSIHVATDDIAIASLTAGTKLVLALPQENAVPYERYLTVQQVNVGAGALASLVVDIDFSLDPAGWTSYPDGVN